MSEHTFDPRRRPGPDRDDRATMRAADLGEALLMELQKPDHDWDRIRRQALALTRVAAAMVPPPARRSTARRWPPPR